MRSVRVGPEKSALNLTTEMGLEHASKERGGERVCVRVCVWGEKRKYQTY